MKNTMKILSLVLALMLAVAVFAGCSSVNQTSSSQPADSSASSSTASTELDYTAFLDDNGMLQGVTATDYVTLPDFGALEIPAETSIAKEEDVQAQIDSLLENYATEKEVTDRAVADGDTVNIDYVGSVDGVEFEGGSTGGTGTSVTIGVTQYIDDFLEQLVGHKPGESFDIEVTFPEDYGKDELNGKDATFAITINHIVEKETPELTEEFVTENLTPTYGYANIAALKEEIAGYLIDNQEGQYLWNWLMDNATVSEVPEIAVQLQEKMLEDSFTSYATQYGVDLDTFATYNGYESWEAVKEGYAESTKEYAKQYLVIQAVVEAQKLEVTEADIVTATGVADLASALETYGEKSVGYLRWATMQTVVQNYLLETGKAA